MDEARRLDTELYKRLFKLTRPELKVMIIELSEELKLTRRELQTTIVEHRKTSLTNTP